LNRLRPEIAARLRQRIEQNVASKIAQFVAEPVTQWYAKAHLWTPLYRTREQIRKRFEENALTAKPAILQLNRHASGQFDNPIIEKWLSAFEAVCHRCNVNLHHQVTRQISNQVREAGRCDLVASACPTQRRRKKISRI